MSDTGAANSERASRLDEVVSGSRVMSAWRAAIASPARALETARVRRLAAPVLDLDAPSQWRAAGVTLIIAVMTHAVALAWLRVPVHVLGWSVRGAVIAAGLFLACRPSALAVAWKDKTGESRR